MKRADKRAEHEVPKESAEFIRGYLMALRFAIKCCENGDTTIAVRESLVESHNEEADYWGIQKVK